ncbi:MAG: phosphoglucosamine mutase [Actinomycetota bacterium]
MPRLFGTDGVRGVANRDLTPELALVLGRAAGRVLAPEGGVMVVGRDTRISGPMLEGALVAGLCSVGVQPALVGIVPTPAVAFLAVSERARGGVVISASHNPIADNGIKFFSDEGGKLTDAVEEEIERRAEDPATDLPTGIGIAAPHVIGDATERYIDHLLGSIGHPLTGLRVVLDCAFGAAFEVAPRAFKEAGAEVIALHAEPDGTRINVDCGSTSLTALARMVVSEGADLGLAFDGDADRVLAVDERGEEVDGDRIMGLAALQLHEAGTLENDVVVVTVMSNMGLRRALEARGIEVVTAQVGDRFVAEEMTARGAVLGGEPSGHVIFARHSRTGDGVLTGFQLAERVTVTGARLSDQAHLFEPYPQVLINVPVPTPSAIDDMDGLWEEVRAAEDGLGGSGRVLLRPSGTEPLVRVMVEAQDEEVARVTAQRLADAVSEHAGG